MNASVYELSTIYDSAKSFYGKAQVVVENGVKTLLSYGTEVMRCEDGNLVRTINQPQSNTTARHMREFARQCSFPWMSKAQLLELPTR